MFQRDFPKEFVFCKGEVFFFTFRHTIIEKPRWKGFYLNISKEYFDVAKRFMTYHIRLKSFIGTNVPQLNLDYANSTQIYNWVRTVMLKNHYSFHDWRASLAWMFVCAVVWRIKGNDERYEVGNNDAEIAVTLQVFLNQHEKEKKWLLKYLSHSHSGGLGTKLRAIYQGEEVGEYDYKEYKDQGPSADLHYNSLVQLVDPQSGRAWLEYLVENPPWQKDEFLFSFKDGQNLVDMLQPYEDKEKNNVLLRIWEYLSYCYENPCIFVFPPLLTKMGPLIKDLSWLSSFKSEKDVTKIITDANPFIKISLRGHMVIRDSTLAREFLLQYSRFPRTKGGLVSYIQSVCISCGLVPETPQKCGGACNNDKIVYCNAECQKKHWKTKHSKECGTK
jgi:hypothetical protein